MKRKIVEEKEMPKSHEEDVRLKYLKGENQGPVWFKDG